MVEQKELRNITLSTLDRARYSCIGDEASIADLARTIKNEGVLEPLLVNELENGEYEIIAGSRRAEAAEKVGLYPVPCLVMSRNGLEAKTDG